MLSYCRAYQAKDFRSYDGSEADSLASLQDEDICYLWADYTLTRDCFDSSDKIIGDASDRWRAFCERSLKFSVPSDLEIGQDV
jgi:hypothetical protein